MYLLIVSICERNSCKKSVILMCASFICFWSSVARGPATEIQNKLYFINFSVKVFGHWETPYQNLTCTKYDMFTCKNIGSSIQCSKAVFQFLFTHLEYVWTYFMIFLWGISLIIASRPPWIPCNTKWTLCFVVKFIYTMYTFYNDFSIDYRLT